MTYYAHCVVNIIDKNVYVVSVFFSVMCYVHFVDMNKFYSIKLACDLACVICILLN
jgi:hypothetical protein